MVLERVQVNAYGIRTFALARTEAGFSGLLSGSADLGGMLLVELLCELALMPAE